MDYALVICEVPMLKRFVLLLGLLSGSAACAQTVPNFRDQHVMGMVMLTVRGSDPDGGRPVQPRTGTAFFVTQDQRLITAKHLFQTDSGKLLEGINIVAHLGSTFGKEVGISPVSLRVNGEFDAAMLKAETPGLGETILPLCFGQPLVVGTQAIALGFPLGHSYAQTIVAVGSPNSTYPGFPGEAFVADGDLNEGNSGGPVLSLRGSVVGVALGGLRGGGVVGQNAILPLYVLQRWIEVVTTINEQCNPPQASSTVPDIMKRATREYKGEVLLFGEQEITVDTLIATDAILRGVPVTPAAKGTPGGDGGVGGTGNGYGANGLAGRPGGDGISGASGQSAPDITIRARTINGHLTVDNSGQSGGDGGMGGNGGPGGAGATGEPSKSGVGAFGVGNCDSGPGRGGDGAQGGAAGAGGAAGHGGNAGKIRVILDEWTPGASLDLVARGGLSGTPGPVGKRGAAGAPGVEGPTSGFCKPSGRSGTPGSLGAPGAQGAVARPGNAAEVILNIAGKEYRGSGELHYP